MPRFKVGDILKHKEYSNIREILEVREFEYRTKQLTPGASCRADYGSEISESINYIDNSYELDIPPLELFVMNKLKAAGYA